MGLEVPIHELSNTTTGYAYQNDEETQTRNVCRYDDNGNLCQQSTFYEDENGRTIKGLYDLDGDGKYDKSSIFTYDDNGKMKSRYDGDVTYDPLLPATTVGLTPRSPRIENYNQYVDFSYDDKGNLITSEEKDLGAIDKITVQIMDETIDNEHEKLVEEKIKNLLKNEPFVSEKYEELKNKPIKFDPISMSDNNDTKNFKKALGMALAPIATICQEMLSDSSEETKQSYKDLIDIIF